MSIKEKFFFWQCLKCGSKMEGNSDFRWMEEIAQLHRRRCGKDCHIIYGSCPQVNFEAIINNNDNETEDKIKT